MQDEEESFGRMFSKCDEGKHNVNSKSLFTDFILISIAFIRTFIVSREEHVDTLRGKAKYLPKV